MKKFRTLMPPPNITGRLHLGHAYEHALIDTITRYKKLQGHHTTLAAGMDHASIATQNRIEAQLRGEGTDRHALGQEAFTERAWKWKEESWDTILGQMQRLGTDADWSQTQFTLDDGPQRSAHQAFKTLWDQGLIYQANRAGAWCPRCSTALSDSELTEDTCTRCKTPTETRTTNQWFLKTEQMTRAARSEYTSGRLKIEPSEMGDQYLEWADRMHDWCISRQLWWGMRMPIWNRGDQYHSFGPGEDIPPGWTQSEDTLDTWFTSGLWPITTQGWPETTEKWDMLITGTDLIFFWALRMMMLCTHLTGQAPFETLLLHGMIRDASGAKLSKSMGNAPDPDTYIAKWGADTLRLSMLRHSRAGADLAFDATDLRGAKAQLDKLRSLANLDKMYGRTGATSTHLIDRWILDKLGIAARRSGRSIENGNLEEALKAISGAVDDLSQTWAEAAKERLRAGDPEAAATLGVALKAILALMHPMAPALTEELGGKELRWPAFGEDPQAREAGDELRGLVAMIRTYRSDAGLSQSTTLRGGIRGPLAHELKTLARLEDGPSGTVELAAGGHQARLAPGPGGRINRKLQEAEDRLARTLARHRSAGFQANASAQALASAAATIERTKAEITRLRMIGGLE